MLDSNCSRLTDLIDRTNNFNSPTVATVETTTEYWYSLSEPLRHGRLISSSVIYSLTHNEREKACTIISMPRTFHVTDIRTERYCGHNTYIVATSIIIIWRSRDFEGKGTPRITPHGTPTYRMTNDICDTDKFASSACLSINYAYYAHRGSYPSLAL